jgi:DNA-binding MarR family transcriptional regulator
MATATEPLLGEVWGLLRTMFGEHRRRFLSAASALALQPAQAGMLLQLGEPLSMRELADRLACDSSNITGLVDRLEARGLVCRHASAEDRRVKHVVLTDDGRRLRLRLFERVGQPAAGVARLSVDEQRTLRDLLARVVETSV